MVRKLFFILGVLALEILLTMPLSSPSNAQTADCIGGCVGAYITCTNSSSESPNCDEHYDKCVEGCIDHQ
jgi:hypothetical protein